MSSATFVFDYRNAIGLCLSVLVAFISGPGGQGGGSFYIPLFSVLLGFSVNEAAALSSSVVFFGCISMVLQAAVSRHPRLPDKPQIDFWSVLMLTPVLIVGLTVGQPFNAAVSQWLLNILVIGIWTWSTIQCFFIYKRTRSKEIEAAAAAAACMPAPSTDDPHLALAAASLQAESRLSRLRTSAAAWWAMQPHKTLWTIAALFGFFLTAQVLRAAAMPICSPAYWAIFGAILLVGATTLLLLCMAVVKTSAVEQQQQHQQQQQQEGKSGDASAASAAAFAADHSGLSVTELRVIVSQFGPMSSDAPAQCRQASELQRVSSSTSGTSFTGLGVLRLRAASCVAAAKSEGLADSPSQPSITGLDAITRAGSGMSQQEGEERGGNAVETSTRAVPTAAAALPSSPTTTSVNIDGIHWSGRAMRAVHPQVFVAGVLLGAWPISPIILATGLHPQVAAATSKMLLFMISGGTGLSFAASGNLNLTYVLAYGLTNAIATPIGVYVVDRWIKRTGRPSIIVWLTMVRLAACVAVQFAFSLVPALIALSKGSLPNAGFLATPLC